MRRNDKDAKTKRKGAWGAACFFCGIPLAILILVVVPLSFKTVEYYQYGLLRKSSTGKMFLGKGVYTTGKYAVGPDYNFKYFQADAHFKIYQELSVFTADRLECILNIGLVYYLNKTELVKLHNTYERQYGPVVDGRVTDAIKNTVPKFKTSQLFAADRKVVQDALFQAVSVRLREVFCYAEDLYLMEMVIPPEVAARQLKTAVQLESNIQESYRAQATQIRQETTKLVNQINNNATIVAQKAVSDATILTSKAKAQAQKIVSAALQEGLVDMYEQLGVTKEEHKTSLDYIRMLRSNAAAKIHVGYSTKISTFESNTPSGA